MKTDKRHEAPGNSKRAGVFGPVLSAVLLALCPPVWAQQANKIPRIGYLTGTRERTLDAPDANRDAFRQGLRDLGYIEEKNIQVEYRYAAGNAERAASLVAELLHLKVDVIVSPVASGILAAKQATKTIPIVIVTNQDPVAAGLVDSLARPGGNITGLTRLTRELAGKRLELLKEVVPTISGVGVLLDVESTVARIAFREYEAAGKTLKIPLQSLEVRSSNPDFEKAFQTAAKGRVSALMTLRNPLLIDNRNRIAELAIQNRLPSMSEGSVFVEAGILASYSSDENDSFRRAALYVDKILKGAKPADLPVEQPTKFEFVVNLKTAKQIGLTIPPNVLARADRIIR
ncbi:MAG TPA: ABC transporter substrate-binding protein [Candidatus Binatia bacterium]|jgi:putative ABC transport system substrate-binding protein|nr:ABC transporter substrate-binding protein [Candidatus Binatia bacterium]